jgi:hypothetical protein
MIKPPMSYPKAICRCNPARRQECQSDLPGGGGAGWLDLEGVSGTITFDKQHNAIKNAVVIGVADGNKTFVESIAP